MLFRSALLRDSRLSSFENNSFPACKFIHPRGKGGKGSGKGNRRGRGGKARGKGGKGDFDRRGIKRMANMLFDHVANAIEKSTEVGGDQDTEESPPKKLSQHDWLKEAKSKFMKSLNSKSRSVQMIRRCAKAVSMDVLDNQRVVMFDSNRFTEIGRAHV